MIHNSFEEWSRYYLPESGVREKIVLDAGAGEGETAYMFLAHGASSVVAIENNPLCYLNLYLNARRHQIRVVPGSFTLEHLLIRHDIAKFDIEGGEEVLLRFNPSDLKPTFAEVHGQKLINRFCDAGWVKLTEPDPLNCYMTNLNKNRTRKEI